MVGLGGLEPPASPLSGVRSNQLSYRPGELPAAVRASFAAQTRRVSERHKTTVGLACSAKRALLAEHGTSENILQLDGCSALKGDLGAKDKPFV